MYITPAYAKQKTGVRKMWVLLFLAALAFVLGGALILLRSAKTPKIPDTVKAQPYEEDKSDDW